MTTTQPISASPLGIAPERLPRHLAIIMDGNGPVGGQRGLPRFAGHRAGAKTVRRIVGGRRASHPAAGVAAIHAVFVFHGELELPAGGEVSSLMDLYVEYMRSQRQLLIDNNIQFAQIGRREGLPPLVLEELQNTLDATRTNTGMTLCLAINYGSRGEITDAVRQIGAAR